MGVIADDGNGYDGIVSDMPSERVAKKAALAECEKRGGGRCEIVWAYHNQCARLARGTGIKTLVEKYAATDLPGSRPWRSDR